MVVESAYAAFALAAVLARAVRISLAELAVEIIFPKRVLLVSCEGCSFALELWVGGVGAGREASEQDDGKREDCVDDKCGYSNRVRVGG